MELFENIASEIDTFLKTIEDDIAMIPNDEAVLKRQVKRLLTKTRTTLHHLENAIAKRSKQYGYNVNGQNFIISAVEDLLSITSDYNAFDSERDDDFYKKYNHVLRKHKYLFDRYLQSLNRPNSNREKSNDIEMLYKSNVFYENNGPNEYVEQMKDAYSHAKELIDDISRDYNLLSSRLSKLADQQKKIDGLEDKYRDAILQVSIDEEEYRNSRSLIEKGVGLANDFLPKVSEIHDNLEKLSSETRSALVDIKSLTSFVNRHDKVYEANLKALDSIIFKAKSVLGDATSAAVGEHFKKQYDRSKRYIVLWPTAGAIFLMGAISICLLTVFPDVYYSLLGLGGVPHVSNADNLTYVISRVLVAPLFLVGAWFCANQYIKQKNIIEDYAHKKVLLLSLLSLKNEIETTGTENTSDFIKAVQKEILKSPLDSLNKKHHSQEAKLLQQVRGQIFENISDHLSGNSKGQDK